MIGYIHNILGFVTLSGKPGFANMNRCRLPFVASLLGLGPTIFALLAVVVANFVPIDILIGVNGFSLDNSGMTYPISLGLASGLN